MSEKIFLGNIRGPQGPQGEPGLQGVPGADGKRGTRWFTGTAVTGISTTGTIFETDLGEVMVNDYYLNTDSGNYYRCTVGGAEDVAEWIFIGNLNAVSLDPSLSKEGYAADAKAVGEAIDKSSEDIMETVSNNSDSLQGDINQINTLLNNINDVLVNYNEYINNNKAKINELIKHVGCGRNKLSHAAKSQTIGNLTFTVNADKSVTINGTGGSDATMFYLVENGSWDDYTIPAGHYVLTGSKGGSNGCALLFEVEYDYGFRHSMSANGDNLYIDIDDSGLCGICNVAIVIYANAKINNMTVYPGLFKSDETDLSYEPGLLDRLKILEAKAIKAENS